MASLGIPMMSYGCHHCLAYYHNLSMTSLKWGYLHVTHITYHIIEKVEEDKMSDDRERVFQMRKRE